MELSRNVLFYGYYTETHLFPGKYCNSLCLVSTLCLLASYYLGLFIAYSKLLMLYHSYINPGLLSLNKYYTPITL